MPFLIIVADFLEGHKLTLSFEEDFSSVKGLEAGTEEGVVALEWKRALAVTLWERREVQKGTVGSSDSATKGGSLLDYFSASQGCAHRGILLRFEFTRAGSVCGLQPRRASLDVACQPECWTCRA